MKTVKLARKVAVGCGPMPVTIEKFLPGKLLGHQETNTNERVPRPQRRVSCNREETWGWGRQRRGL